MKYSTQLSLALVLTLVFSACRSSKEEANPHSAIRVQAQAVSASKQPRTLELSGSLQAFKTIKLGFLVAGKIDSLPVKENGWVEAGQLIARLDATNYQIAAEIAGAQADQAQDEYDRLEKLRSSGGVSAADFSKISNGLRQAKAQLKLQRKNLADTRLTSPIAGVLLNKGSEEGEIAPTGLPLFTVAAIQPIRVVAQIPEQELRFIALGQKAWVGVTALGLETEGRITRIGKAADPTTRAFPVEVELPNRDKNLLPGMLAEMRIPQVDSSPEITVPLASLRRLGSETAVFTLDKAASRVYERKVSLGKIYGDRVEVTSGLANGDWVITSGASELQNGVAVNVAGVER